MISSRLIAVTFVSYQLSQRPFSGYFGCSLYSLAENTLCKKQGDDGSLGVSLQCYSVPNDGTAKSKTLDIAVPPLWCEQGVMFASGQFVSTDTPQGDIFTSIQSVHHYAKYIRQWRALHST